MVKKKRERNTAFYCKNSDRYNNQVHLVDYYETNIDNLFLTSLINQLIIPLFVPALPKSLAKKIKTYSLDVGSDDM